MFDLHQILPKYLWTSLYENSFLMIGITDQSDYSICHFVVRLFIHTVRQKSKNWKFVEDIKTKTNKWFFSWSSWWLGGGNKKYENYWKFQSYKGTNLGYDMLCESVNSDQEEKEGDLLNGNRIINLNNLITNIDTFLV